MTKHLICLICIISCFCLNVSGQEICDSSFVIQSDPDSINSDESFHNDSIITPPLPTPNKKYDWKKEMLSLHWDIKDTTIVYPKFLQFCVDTYNWADRTFNSYNPEYVVGTGRRWKAYIKNDNFSDNYAMHFHDRLPIRMLSDITCTVGAHLSYMAVSVGYTLDFSNIIGNKPSNLKKFEFNFSCALFSAEAYYSENNGGSKIRHFGDYENGKWITYDFRGLSLKTFGLDAYYFFNNKKYAQGAAYNFSKIQKKSAGSLIAGITISNQDIYMDFSTLPIEMQQYLPTEQRKYRFHYNDFDLMVGYGYNCVMGKHWLFNITGLPAIGFKHNFADSVDGEGEIFSMKIKGKLSFMYNLGDFFAGLIGKVDGHWYINKHYDFINFMQSFSLNAGVRF